MEGWKYLTVTLPGVDRSFACGLLISEINWWRTFSSLLTGATTFDHFPKSYNRYEHRLH